MLGCNILPARVLRPTDKQSVERTFGAIRSLLFELLRGYTGVDVADRGEDPEADADLTIERAEHVIATWIVRVWQNRKLGEHAPSWDPQGDHSPNSLFAASMAQGGFAMQIPSPELYYELLPAHHVQIHHERGVKIGRLWYDGDALNEYRNEPSMRGGKHERRYLIRSDPRDARSVFFQDPKTHDWHSLRWKGLPPSDEIPSFGDARVREMLTAARKSGLKPQTDRELLPVLLDLLGAYTLVESWTSLPKAKRTEITRDDARGRAAAADRPAEQPVRLVEPKPAAAQASKSPMVVEPRWPQKARDIDNAVDADRHSRRVEAVQQQAPLTPPARLGEAFRRGNLFLLTNDEHADSNPAE